MSYSLNLRVWRGDAAGGELQDYHVVVEEGEVVLDALHRLQAKEAGDLAIRWNCKAGKCGSCSAEVNGRPGLLCMMRLSSYEQNETLTITPLRTFPIIRDLVTDVSYNYEVAERVPAFQPGRREADGTYRMQQEDVERSQEFRKCIECWLCQNTCHVIRDHDENKKSFAGPRFFIRYAELDMHPLDTNDRRRLLQDQNGLGLCNITKCCSEVCPEGIKITDNGIIPMKERVVDAKYDPVYALTSLLPRRDLTAARQAYESGDFVAAEAGARTTLAQHPRDRSAQALLQGALAGQGRFTEALDVARGALDSARPAARGELLNNIAWLQLCAVEAGQLGDGGWSDQVDAALREAESEDNGRGSGTYLLGTRALFRVLQGDAVEGEELVQHALSWARSPQARAEELLTLAEALAQQGRQDEATDAVASARAEDPNNPRLRSVEARVERDQAGAAVSGVTGRLSPAVPR
jgi:succinate dehydrogenase / fumarate reductase, iron-sulfur subunit